MMFVKFLTINILAAVTLSFTVVQAATFEEAQSIKVEQLQKAAANAVDQQRKENFPPQTIEATYEGIGNVTVETSTDWDADGDGKCLKITVKDIPANFDHIRIPDRLAIRFANPTNLLEKATGLTLWIRTPRGLSKDLRFGAHFKCQGTDQDPVIISDTPLVHKFGDNPHQAYLDWGYIFSHDVRPMQGAPKELLTKVNAIELTFVQKRLPHEQVKLEPASGIFYLDGLQLVDFYNGSYDSDRFPKNKPINYKQPITSQGRTQQVAVICAKYGGEQGVQSAILALDMMASIQCWDGTWPVLQTRMQGEYTFGMILADMARAYESLREQNRPELDEKITIRHWTMTRRDLYELMIYRAAISRAPGPIHKWRDTYCSGEGALTSGCNRPMYFIVSQYVAAQILSDPAQKKEIMAEYDINMNDLVAYQGITAGGWPIFGEGDRYRGKGLHWDCGYTTDHVFIMAVGSRVTGDKRWGTIMKKFDTVVEAMMLSDGLRIDGGLSERGRARSGGIKAPDIVYQEASRHNATSLAQWGANVSQRAWSNWPNGGSQWPSCDRIRGYGLGAFLTWLTYDMQAEPQPQTLNHVFDRQWPIWIARWIDKEGNEVRSSKIIVRPNTSEMINTFKWEVGQYPVLGAVPLAMTVEGNSAVDITAANFTGNLDQVPADATISLAIKENGKVQKSQIRLDNEDRFDMTFSGEADVSISLAMDTTIKFTASPRKAGETVTLHCRLLRQPEPYKHLYTAESDADIEVSAAGINLVDPATGTKVVPINCYPNQRYAMDRALDDNPDTVWIIGGFKPGIGLRFVFTKEVSLDKLIFSQGDWQNRFHLAKDITVKLSDGTTKKITLQKKPGENVEINLDGVQSNSLTLMVDSIYEAEGNDSFSGGWNELKILTADN